VAAALAVLVLLLLWPSLVGGKVFSSGDNIFLWPPFSALRPTGWLHPTNFNLTDPVLGFLPDLSQTRSDVLNGTAPLWNPYAAAGRPLLASQVYAPLFPLTWLAFVLPFWSSLGWIAAGKLLLAGAGMYLLCREIELRPGAALLGAIAYPFGTYFIAWLEHPQTNVWAVLPWMFFAARRICGRGSLAATALLGCATGLACLGGHPESAGFLLVATAAYAAFELIAERLRRPASARSLTGPTWTEPLAGRAVLVTVGVVLGLGVGAIVNLPLAELLGQSGPVQRSWPGLPLKLGWAFFFPEMWGNPSKAFASGAVNFNERTAYIGALPLLLAAASLGPRRPREQWFFVAMLAIVLVTIFNTPLWAEGVRGLPEGKVAALHRLLIIVSFAGAVLAAFGLQRWLGASRRERRRMLAIMGTAALIPVAAWLARHPGALENLVPALSQLPGARSGETRAGVVALGSVWRWLLLCSLGLGGLALLLRRGSPTLAVALAVALVGIDLVTLDYGFHGQLKRPLVDPPVPAAIRYLQRSQGQQRMVASGIELPSNLAERYDLRDARVAIDIPYPSRYADLWDGLGGTGGDQELFHADDRNAHRLADVFAVRQVLLSPGESVPSWLRPVFRSSGGIVAVNSTALPRAWVAYDWRRASGRRADLAMTLGSATARLRDQPVIETTARPPSARAPAVSSATVADNGPEGVTIDAIAGRSGYLILDDSAYPGWKAYLDGHPVRWYSANENFRAVAIPAGRHVIRFRYRPASALNGAIVSGFCVLVLVGIALAAVMLQRPRRTGNAPVREGFWSSKSRRWRRNPARKTSGSKR
jgi:hypothetical protein